MVVETRVSSRRGDTRMDGHAGSAPSEEGPSYVRLVCRVTVQRATSRLGGRGGLADVERAGPVRISEAKHLVDDPSAFLNYDRIRQIVWHELSGMPALRGLHLSPSDWDTFEPDNVAGSIIRIARGNDDRGLCGGHYRFAFDMDVEVTLVFSEPKALLRHCMQILGDPAVGDRCGICLHDGGQMSLSKATPPLVNLPCGHVFHTRCVLKWFFKDTVCPLCHRDLRGLVACLSPYPGRDQRLRRVY